MHGVHHVIVNVTDLGRSREFYADPPREYDYTPGYYAVFFTDPDGMKVELVHIPGFAAEGPP